VKTKEKELILVMEKQTEKLQNYIDVNVNDWVRERSTMLAQSGKQFKEIKLVCCKYFEKYDKQLEGVLD